MNRRTTSLAAVFAVASMPAAAQWLNVPAKGIPRAKDGKPNLSAAAPRKPDGKPDPSGIWQTDPPRSANNLASDFKPGELPVQPWAAKLWQERQENNGKDRPPGLCLPLGVPLFDLTLFKIVQEPDLVVILYEALGGFRQIFLDGRTLPEDQNPTWMGYSVGRWDGDTLVVETAGFNGKTWLDLAGHPSTDALHITERLRRTDFGHLDIQFTIDDPKAYSRPWTVTFWMQLLADTELLEYVCNENEKDRKHLPGR
jgi:hypothetical protein